MEYRKRKLEKDRYGSQGFSETLTDGAGGGAGCASFSSRKEQSQDHGRSTRADAASQAARALHPACWRAEPAW
jgi:hypothetical protein